jgi:hypothetical protein
MPENSTPEPAKEIFLCEATKKPYNEADTVKSLAGPQVATDQFSLFKTVHQFSCIICIDFPYTAELSRFLR